MSEVKSLDESPVGSRKILGFILGQFTASNWMLGVCYGEADHQTVDQKDSQKSNHWI